MSRDVVLLLEDIQTSCEKIVRFTAGGTRDEVLADELRFDAILRNLHVIGEAVKNLPPEWRQEHPDARGSRGAARAPLPLTPETYTSDSPSPPGPRGSSCTLTTSYRNRSGASSGSSSTRQTASHRPSQVVHHEPRLL